MSRQAPVGIDSGQAPCAGQTHSRPVTRRLEVALRRRPVAAAAVEHGQLVFDAGQSTLPGPAEGRGRLQAVSAVPYSPARGLQIADGFVQGSRVGMAQRQGSSVMRQCFGVGIQARA